MSCLRCYRSGCTGTRRGRYPFPTNMENWGKPQIVNIPKKFNLSHSGDYVVCAVRRRRSGSGHSEMGSLSRNGRQSVFLRQRRVETAAGDCRASQRTELFYRLWGRKEAYGKYTGQGIGSVSGRRFLRRTATGRKSRYVSGNGFWRIAIRWRSVTEQQKRKMQGKRES